MEFNTETYKNKHAVSSPQLSVSNSWCQTYTPVFWSSWFVLDTAKSYAHAQIQSEFRTRTRRPHPSQQANSSYMLELRVYVWWQRSHSAQTLILPDCRNRYDREQLPCLSLCERLGGPQVQGAKRLALSNASPWPPSLCTWCYHSDQSWAFREYNVHLLCPPG